MPWDDASAGSEKGTTNIPPADELPTQASPHVHTGFSSLPLFHRDQLVAGRFKILRLIGQGGMGAVYEAEDQELGGRIALKTVRPEATADPRIVERFKQEIYLARKVTHPNVCRIFDLFHHQPSPSERPLVFLTMEMLPGETLAQRLRRTGRMQPAEALPLVRHMAAALSAAHQAGIVHRDFKPSNVVLVPSKESPEGVRAVVTDFGLAQTSSADSSVVLSVTGTGEVVGSPAYMAPEQLGAEETTAAADIYALGVVMYEMVAGQPPFSGDTPFAVAVQRLQRPAASPRSFVPDLDATWEAVILRCLERRPDDRFASTADVVSALAGEKVPAAPRAARRRTAWIAAAIVIAAATAGFVVSRLNRAPAGDVPAPSAASPITPRRAVAVLGFKNLSQRSDAAWLSTALSEMLTSELAAGEKLRMIPGEQVVRMKMDLALADAESFATDTLARIRTSLGTDLVVLGSFVALGERAGAQIRLDLRVQDAAAGETIASVTETGTEAELLGLVSRMGAALRDKLGVGGLSATEAAGMRASMPSDPAAARAYTEGLARLRVSENLAARDLLLKAVTAEPGYPLAHSALATAWSALGYDAKAAEAAKRAFELSNNLSREERLSIEGQYRQIAAEPARAAEIYRTLYGFFPDDLDYGLRLTSVQVAAGSGKDALATVDSLRKLPPPASEDPRIDLAEAAAAGALSDFTRQQAAAAKATSKATAQNARLILALARIAEGDGFLGLGDSAKAIAAFEDGQRIFAAAGDRGGVATALNRIGSAREARGELVAASALLEQALATYREIGNRRAVATTANSVGIVQLRQGHLPEALKLYEEALGVFREIGSQSGAARAINGIANVRREQGDFAAARQGYGEVLAIGREIGQKTFVATALSNIANIDEDQGDLAASQKASEEALAIARELGERNSITRIMRNLAGVLGKQGELPRAKSLFEESLVMSREIGNKRSVARGLSSVGDVMLHQGDLAGATKRYEEALAIAKEEREQADVAIVLAQLGNVFLAQNRLADARRQHEEALAIRQAIGQKRIEPDSDIDLARLAIEEGHAADAERLARRAADTFRSQAAGGGEASALAVAAEALRAQGKETEARAAVERASSLSRDSQNRLVRMPVAIASARVHGTGAGTQAAAQSLKASLDEAVAKGLFGLQLEARLALGEVEMSGRDPAAGRSRLAALEKDADAKGFALIARKARAAIKK